MKFSSKDEILSKEKTSLLGGLFRDFSHLRESDSRKKNRRKIAEKSQKIGDEPGQLPYVCAGELNF